MFTAHLHLVEFLDTLPMRNCVVRMRIDVMPMYPGTLTTTSAGDKPHNTDIPVPDHSRRVPLEDSAITDSESRATITIDAGATAAQLMTVSDDLGHMPIGVQYERSFSANAFGVEMLWTQPEVLTVAGSTPSGPALDAGDLDSLTASLGDGGPERVLVIDVAKSIVGDVSDMHATLWFQLHGAPDAGLTFHCELHEAGGGGQPQRANLTMNDPARALSEMRIFLGLKEQTPYQYFLFVRTPSGEDHLLTQGHFRTLPKDPKRMVIAFGSCHQPANEEALGRWKALAQRTDQDVFFMIGDQIYGDGVEDMDSLLRAPGSLTEDDWFNLYKARYDQLWAYQPMRNTLRSRPTYMILDDHDVKDDWGVASFDDGPDRLKGALRAYNVYQQSHNPGGYSVPPYDYHFARGRAAFYFTDSRTARMTRGDYPVLGQAQVQRIQQWARSDEVLNADLIFVIVPVPPAILPFEQLEHWARIAAPTTGLLAGMLVGAIIGGPVGAVIGGVLGAASASAYYEYTIDTINEPDIRDAWTYDKNVPDLVRLLNILFDVANDIGPDGKAGAKPKGVFVLSGDYHFGALHELISKRKDGGHDHRNNSRILQITSSPISKAAVNDEIMNDVMAYTTENVFLGANGDTFPLDYESKHYEGKFKSRLMERNFGRIEYEYIGPGRKYRVYVTVEGDSKALVDLFELDLDKRPVQMRSLIGQTLQATGRITMLRVNEEGDGYGPTSDHIDAEVIIELDTRQGQAFGFTLRKESSRWSNPSGNRLNDHRRMLELLRDAFTKNRMVSIEYKRTGIRNGTLIRATALS